MRMNLPLPLLLCFVLATLPSRQAVAFSSRARISTPIRDNTTSSQQRYEIMLLHAATLDGSMFIDDNRPPTPTAATSLKRQQRKEKSIKYLTVALGGYFALLLRKLTWEDLLSYPADCTADMIEASCRKSFSSSSVALGTAFVSLFAAFRMMIRSSLQLSLSGLTGWYLRRLEAAPLITKCITGGLIAFSGDYGAQWFEYKSQSNKLASKSKAGGVASGASELVTSSPRAGSLQPKQSLLSIHGNYNFRRGLARFLECMLISSPLMHYGYDLFERIVPTTPTHAVSGLYSCLAALSHVVADSVFLDGIFVMTGIIATSLMEGHPLRKVLPNLRSVYVPTLKASVVTSSALMPLQFLSFRFLPVQLRVLSVNAVDLIWTGVVSFVSHGDHGEGVSASA